MKQILSGTIDATASDDMKDRVSLYLPLDGVIMRHISPRNVTVGSKEPIYDLIRSFILRPELSTVQPPLDSFFIVSFCVARMSGS